ncbi:phenylacetate-CoA oxygenase subunit PaaI [Enterovibrio norvegicus]|uniref:1,2-phenylacetyl-CoA epoxidase subunit PaaC n=1 Tax=Enterovibrio norvegicus TaxID=188144 RepID=A0ABV4L698_9GAMM|nr:1,2-phenylacetyl-CoA epoxidase subunit PaaC [Enterovibrio norvegicus]MCC4796735.1 phenylacetate-CoA oxygenase subunit PaaC [Enterovibrio norvegicus]OEF55578.1 phenylacetate-CoA oxygenase subunit PaaI [Enterovibrio norvegicus]PMH62698.1 phenylacetate-CoA oxygenase subunit PaaI [Enterovibrio norvegicus]PMI34577.1 phenylacetate-CoA oxygenase subunit PaaI [Enterovibrio norvegicus]PMI37320.1 phenylacetate-CoA oxygenase subunit PaaI [Enterovibrio norvegicus]
MMEQQKELLRYVLSLGDDALTLGHRLSEWASHGPFLEEDIALGNVALDYLGRARMFYGYAAELTNGEKSEDDFAFLRDERQYTNHLINELPRGDFAFTMARQLIVDIYQSLVLVQLVDSRIPMLSAIAQKSIKETRYHLMRSQDWVVKLGDGTEESHQRMQGAFNDIWGYIPELFEPDDGEKQLIDAEIAVNTPNLKNLFHSKLAHVLEQATLTVPADEWAVRGGRAGYHTEHLSHLLCVMQSVHRAYPGCEW